MNRDAEGRNGHGPLYRALAWLFRPLVWLYRTLVSLKTSLVFLAFLGILFFLGTVFPQSTDPDRLEHYRQAGGKLIGLVDALDLLNIFRSRYFGVITLLFMLHLLLCSIHRLGLLRRRSSIRMFTREDVLRHGQSFSIVSPQPSDRVDIEKVLGQIGFRRRKYYSEDRRVVRIVSERGLPYRWLSWLYHVCFMLAIVGFVLSYLFAFEDYLTIGAGETTSVALRSDDTNWRTLVGDRWPEDATQPRTIELKLERFISEYTEKLELAYPDSPIQRSLAVWGLGTAPVHYEMPADPLYPRDWFSKLSVFENGRLAKRQTIEVNDPLRYAGVTFYQMGYDYQFDLSVGQETIENVKAGVPFTIPQMEGEFRIKDPRMGMLFAYDGTVKKLAPRATLQHRPPSGKLKAAWTTAGNLPIGRPTEIMHVPLKLDNLKVSSVLSYRFDPGMPLLWVAGIGLIILMAARIYFPWYQLRCHVEGVGEQTQVAVSVRMMGLLARPARMQQKLCNVLQGRVEQAQPVSP